MREYLYDRDAEALAYLSAVLTAFTLLMNFVLQKLGIVLSEKELAKLKEKTLLKQVGPFTVAPSPESLQKGQCFEY